MGNTVTQAKIDAMLKNATIEVSTHFDKCTIVAVQLENGFVLVESSACVDPANYDPKMGKAICMERIKSKMWELEGYQLQNELHKAFLQRERTRSTSEV